MQTTQDVNRYNETHKTPDSASLERFKSALDALVGADRFEARISALLDLFSTRCGTARELKTVGEAMFAALSSSRPRPTVIGRYHERFLFCRVGDQLEVSAEGLQLATLRLEEAIRLATLLHGASDIMLDRLRAA
jgi:hypothetical protein